MKTAKKTRTFLPLCFLFSWLVWGGMLMFPISAQFFIPLLFLGAFGPSLVAIYMVQTSRDSRAIKGFWLRVVDIRRIGWKWLLLIFLIFPMILLVGYSFLFLLGEELPNFSSYFSGLVDFEAVAFFLIFMMLGGPLAEELGWRGYILDPLQEKWGRLGGSIMVGSFWVLWHLPLFFIEGTSQFEKGFGITFWSWALQIMVLSVIFTWVYNHTQKSILAAVLLHFMANFAYPLDLDVKGEVVFSLVRLLVTLPIILSWYKGSPAKEKIVARFNLS